MPDIAFHFADKPKLNWKILAWKRWLRQIAYFEHHQIVSLEYVFCSDEFLLKINQESLQHDEYTDIITFDLRDEPVDGNVEGEIYISLDRVADNAQKYNVPFEHELARVMAHGLLHLCGYGDKTQAEQKVMRSKEDHYIALAPL